MKPKQQFQVNLILCTTMKYFISVWKQIFVERSVYQKNRNMYILSFRITSFGLHNIRTVRSANNISKYYTCSDNVVQFAADVWNLFHRCPQLEDQILMTSFHTYSYEKTFVKEKEILKLFVTKNTNNLNTYKFNIFFIPDFS